MLRNLKDEIIQAINHFIGLYGWELLDLNNKVSINEFLQFVLSHPKFQPTERDIRYVVARVYGAMQYDAIIGNDKGKRDQAFTEIHKLMYRIAFSKWQHSLDGIAEDIPQTAIRLVFKRPTPKEGRAKFWAYLIYSIYREAQTIELRRWKKGNPPLPKPQKPDETNDDTPPLTVSLPSDGKPPPKSPPANRHKPLIRLDHLPDGNIPNPNEKPIDEAIFLAETIAWLYKIIEEWKVTYPKWHELIKMDIDCAEMSDDEKAKGLNSNANAIRQRRIKYRAELKAQGGKDFGQDILAF